jgi:hypothetical protein
MAPLQHSVQLLYLPNMIGGVVGTQFTWPAGSTTARQLRSDARKGIHLAEVDFSLQGENAVTGPAPRRSLRYWLRPAGDSTSFLKMAACTMLFYAPEYQGKVEIRGLDRHKYTVTDYENGNVLGTVQGPTASLDVKFAKHLLLEAKPQ